MIKYALATALLLTADPAQQTMPIHYTLQFNCPTGEGDAGVITTDPDLLMSYVMVAEGRINDDDFLRIVEAQFPDKKPVFSQFLTKCLGHGVRG